MGPVGGRTSEMQFSHCNIAVFGLKLQYYHEKIAIETFLAAPRPEPKPKTQTKKVQDQSAQNRFRMYRFTMIISALWDPEL